MPQQHTRTFDTLYQKLNPAQKRAVDVIDGPVMVIAGPGTGKTQILTLRIANILRQTDIPADAILALTFTNAAALNMRKRLVSIIGAEAYRVSIYTFHSFANHLIDCYSERFGTIAGFGSAGEVEQIDIVRALLASGHYEFIKPIGDPFRHVPDILRAITHLKKEGITPKTFETLLKKDRAAFDARDDLIHKKGAHEGKMKVEGMTLLRMLQKNEELAAVYARYQEELARRKRYDFDDALLLLVGALETDEDFLRELQEEYQYFLVDEHQDTSGAQNRILELLVSFFDRPNLFVVGDEKQAIFRFQGASLANFLYFEKKFRDVERITLTENYRSHQGLLDAAHALITHARESLAAPLFAKTGTPAKIHLARLGADEEELLYLAESVQKKITEGVLPHEIAVLYRNNRDAEGVRDYFERLGIPFIVENKHGVLADRDIRALNLILGALADLENDDALAKILFVGFLEIPIPDAYTLINAAKKTNTRLYTLLRAPTGLALLKEDIVRALGKKILAWKRAAENEPFPSFFERVVRESDVLLSIERSPFHIEKFDKLVQLFDELKALTNRNPFFTLADYLAFLSILEEHHLTLEAEPRRIANAVRLMTAHKAKGLEFDYVFVIGAYDGHWGSRRVRSFFRLPSHLAGVPAEDEQTEDERRLFYVALTRARRDVWISYAERAPDGRERVPTQFLEEIPPVLKEEHTAEMLGVAGKRPPLFVARAERDEREKYLEFVRAHFLERGFSATSLNNYLHCPWRWFYRDFFHRQFVQTPQQEKGTAVHAALEDFFNARNTRADTPPEYLLERFRVHFLDANVEESARERILRDMSAALLGWVSASCASWGGETKNEFRVKGVVLEDGTLLSGVIDRLDFLDEKKVLVRVVDYKTGRPKSRNEIEGKTKAKNAGDYFRQLVFYRLLLEKYEAGRYSMEEGLIDFIEPNERGLYKKEAFAIESEAVRALEATILRAAEEVRTLAFWGKRCGDPDCEECALREVMIE